jgi:hypothetical protein
VATMAMTGVLPHVKCIPTSFISRLTHDPTTVLALTYKLKSPVPSLRGQGITSAVASHGFTRAVTMMKRLGVGPVPLTRDVNAIEESGSGEP